MENQTTDPHDIEIMKRQLAELQAKPAIAQQSMVTGSGAAAQGGGDALGAHSVKAGGANSGTINAGTQSNINTGGGAYVGGNVDLGGGNFIGRDRITHTNSSSPQDLERLFAPLLAAIAQQAPAGMQAAAERQAAELMSEVAKGEHAEDGKIARIIDGLAGMAPGAVGAVVSLFATPILDGIVGPVTKFVLDKLKPS